MSDFSILHNPRCSKSRQTLELLQENGVEPTIVKYLETPPTQKVLKAIVNNLGVNPRDILRKKEAEYKKAGLDNEKLSDAQVIKLMIEYPKVIERPIVYNDKVAAIGRPPENVLELLK